MKKHHVLVTNEQGKGEQFVSMKLSLNAGKVRSDTLEGRPCYVTPVVMILEGVHNGSLGQLLYKEEQLAASTSLWDNKPIVVYHPTKSATACTPEVLNEQGVGVLLNTSSDHKGPGGAFRLTSEAWVYKERAMDVDSRVLHALKNQKTMEVSTGLFLKTKSEAGVFNGEEYTHTTTDYRPDHLALLPDKVGACSIADGAGLVRNEAGGIVLNEKSYDTIRSMVAEQLNIQLAANPDKEARWGYISDLYSDSVVYCCGGKTLRAPYSISDGNSVTINLDAAEQVTRVVSYEPVKPPKIVSTNQTMNKTQKIDQLISSQNTQWEESDRAFLTELPEKDLERIHNAAMAGKKKKGAEEEGGEMAEDGCAGGKKAANAVVPAAPTLASLLAAADPALRESIEEMQAASNEMRTQLSTRILAAPGCAYNEDELRALPLHQLKKIVALLPAAANNEQRKGSFAGQALVHNGAPASPEAQVLHLPSLNEALAPKNS